MKYLLLTGLLVFASNALAATITLDATNSGHYISDGTHNGNESNIFAGTVPTLNSEVRNWIAFDLSSVTDEITSASLQIFNKAGNDPDINFTWSEITTPFAEITTPSSEFFTGNGTEIYDDLASGWLVTSPEFASGVANADGIDNYILTAEALLSLNGATGTWAMGGSTADDLGKAYGLTDGVSSPEQLIQLTLVTVPLPAAFWLLLSGLISMAGITRRKRFQH